MRPSLGDIVLAANHKASRQFYCLVLLAAVVLVNVALTPKADADGPLQVVLLPDLIPSVAGDLVPTPMDLPAGPPGSQVQATLMNLRYCGQQRGLNKGAAIGVFYPGHITQPQISAAFAQGDCGRSSSDIARTLLSHSGSPDWVAVAKMSLDWVPWQLKLSIAEVEEAAKQNVTAPTVDKSVQTIKVYATDDLGLLPDRGASHKISIALEFEGENITAGAFFDNKPLDPQSELLHGADLTSLIKSAPETSDLIVNTPYALVNAIVQLYAPTIPIPVNINGSPQQLIAKDLFVGGSTQNLDLTGKIEEPGTASYNAAILCAGDDLKVSKILLNAPQAPCGGDPISRAACLARNASLRGTAAVAEAALTIGYQNQFLRPSAVAKPLHFNINSNEYDVLVRSLRSSATSSSIQEMGRIWIEKH